MWQKLISDRRVALLWPYMALAALALIYFIVWVGLAAGTLAQMRDAGFSWTQATRSGFPARLTMAFDAPRFADATSSWQTRSMTLTLMPWSRDHAVLDFYGVHRLTNDTIAARLSHDGHMASLVFDTAGLARVSTTLTQPDMTLTLAAGTARLLAAKGEAHMRRQGDSARLDIALLLQGLSVNGGTAMPVAELMLDISPDMLAARDAADLSGQTLGVQKLKLQRKAVTMVARGRIKLAESGYLTGQLDVDFVNLPALIETLEEFGLSDRRQRARLLLLAQLTAALGGDTSDRVSLPLIFKNNRLWLGPLNLGPAPRWRS